jgi:hypothetical protein
MARALPYHTHTHTQRERGGSSRSALCVPYRLQQASLGHLVAVQLHHVDAILYGSFGLHDPVVPAAACAAVPRGVARWQSKETRKKGGKKNQPSLLVSVGATGGSDVQAAAGALSAGRRSGLLGCEPRDVFVLARGALVHGV